MKLLPNSFDRIGVPLDGPDRRPLGRLFTRLSRFASGLDYDAALASAGRRREVEADVPIWADPAADQSLIVLESGFAYSFEVLGDGRRYINDFYGPGAVCNWARLWQPGSHASLLVRGAEQLGPRASQGDAHRGCERRPA